MKNNICITTDSYKLNHWNQYPNETEIVYSYFEARKGAKFDNTVFFGLQEILKKYVTGARVTEDNLNQARLLVAIHFGQATAENIKPYILNNHLPVYTNVLLNENCENEMLVKKVNPHLRVDWDRFFKETNQREYFNFEGWNHILKNHNGRLPVRIRAVREGTPVPISNVLITVENTDPKCFWLTNFLETILSQVWYPSTVATLSREVKKMEKRYLDKNSTGGLLQFMLHDFGYRGVSSYESAGLGGAAHLVNFMGTDTVVAMEYAMAYYDANLDGLAYSVAATEHSIMTARGAEGEIEVMQQLLDEYPKGILSVVSDSYDIYNFVDQIVGNKFKDRILNREGIFVVRPDSVTPTHPTPEGEMVWLAENLYKNFGGTVNAKGYKVINPKVRLLWGDGIDFEGIEAILKALDEAGFAAENIACFGMGGGLLQKVNRDTMRFAFKSCAQKRNGVWYDVFKNPKDITKASKRGKLKLIKVEGAHGTTYTTVAETAEGVDELVTVFENGELKNEITFDDVRKNAAI